MLDQVVDEPVLGLFNINMDLRGVFETVPCCWIVPVSLRRTTCDDGHDVVLQGEGDGSLDFLYLFLVLGELWEED